jgi:hypothetical protein
VRGQLDRIDGAAGASPQASQAESATA